MSKTVLGDQNNFLNSFIHFSWLYKHSLPIEYHIHIWQVSLQQRDGNTCQMWMRFHRSNEYLKKKPIYVIPILEAPGAKTIKRATCIVILSDM